ncbi:hypothetical protein ACOME3_008076 [Neoechinorhynchus agilis]
MLPIGSLCYEGRMDDVVSLLTSSPKPADVVNKKDSTGRSAFHWACSNGSLDLVKALVEEFGADVNVKDDLGWTGLMVSVSSNRNPNLIAYLINGDGHGGPAIHQINWTNDNCQNILQMEFLISRIHYAASKNSLETCRLVLETKRYNMINDSDRYGSTALHRAVCKASQALCEYLIERGARVDKVDCEGNSAVHLACQEERKRIAIMLVEKAVGSVNVNNLLKSRNKSGLSALDLATDPSVRKMFDDAIKKDREEQSSLENLN